MMLKEEEEEDWEFVQENMFLALRETRQFRGDLYAAFYLFDIL